MMSAAHRRLALPGLGELAPLLACDPQLFAPLETLIRQLSTDDTWPAGRLTTARTNGSPTCFDARLPTGRVKRSSPAICGRATVPSITGSSSILRPGLSTAVQPTRSPDRFSAAQTPPRGISTL